jgi:hydrogenase maturation protease
MDTLRCLILACGNTLRSDDGVGPHLAAWAEERFRDSPAIRVISCQQWTPDLAEDIAWAASVLFIDCSIEAAPGNVALTEVNPAATESKATHHASAAQLLALARDLYSAQPTHSAQLTVGAGSIELGETFSKPVHDAIPCACELLQRTVNAWRSENG